MKFSEIKTHLSLILLIFAVMNPQRQFIYEGDKVEILYLMSGG